MEHMPDSMFKEKSGDATDSWNRYAEDFALAASLGLNAFRFGIEWARIEPEQGLISNTVLDHYDRVIDSCLAHGMTPVATLHHFSSPHWILPDAAGRTRVGQAVRRLRAPHRDALRRSGELVLHHQ